MMRRYRATVQPQNMHQPLSGKLPSGVYPQRTRVDPANEVPKDHMESENLAKRASPSVCSCAYAAHETRSHRFARALIARDLQNAASAKPTQQLVQLGDSGRQVVKVGAAALAGEQAIAAEARGRCFFGDEGDVRG